MQSQFQYIKQVVKNYPQFKTKPLDIQDDT